MTALGSAARPATPSRRASVARRQGRAGYAFVAPYVLFMLAFAVVPICYCIYLAFTDGTTGSFSGLDNFIHVQQDFRYVPALEHLGLFLLVWLIPSIVILVGLALLLQNRPGPISAGLRALYYLPSALVGSASVIVWLFMLTPSVSPYGAGLHALNLHAIFEVISPGRLPFVIAMINFWTGAGGWILVLHGALTSISPSLIEAARLDGANEWQLVRYVKLPLLRKWISYLVILNLAGGSQVFVEPQLISTATHLGVATNWAPNQLGYSFAFSYSRFNDSAALSLELLLFGLIAAVVIVTRTKLFQVDV